MTDRDHVSRRVLLGAAGSGIAGALGGCGSLSGLFPRAKGPGDARQSDSGRIAGLVSTTDGTPLPEATVAALGEGSRELTSAGVGDDGTFAFTATRPVFLKVSAPGYLPRVAAVAPGSHHTIELSASAGTASLTFGGDVMFGRRFYESGTDRLNPRVRIDPETRRADHRRILAGIEPLLSVADVTSVNLETPLTTTDWRHPDKRFRYVSHPVAAPALAAAGVDYVALGNNHAFDALTPGLRETTQVLDEEGIAHSGAGLSPREAWRPRVVRAAGLRIAFLSCTTIVGASSSLPWSTDRRARPTSVTSGGRELTVEPGPGVAGASTNRLRERVAETTDLADLVVVQIHGGEPYQPAPPDRMQALTETAAAAGADLVVNHHPHVIGGIDRIGSTVVARSMGNLIFDQKLWPTFPTALLTAHVTEDGVTRLFVDPLLIDGFVPRGVVGKPNRFVTWRTAALSDAGLEITRRGLSVTGAGAGANRASESLGGHPAIYARERGWVTDLSGDDARLGRDLLPTGSFGSVDVDDTGFEAPLWRFGREPPATAPGLGHDQTGGIELVRVGGNSSRAILSNSRRIPVDGPLTLTCLYRADADESLEFEAAWYADTADPRFSTDLWTLEATGGEWVRLTRDLEPPQSATHLNLLFALEAPIAGRTTAAFDDVRLISWAPDGTTGGRGWDHLRVDGTAHVQFVVPSAYDSPHWLPVPGTE